MQEVVEDLVEGEEDGVVEGLVEVQEVVEALGEEEEAGMEEGGGDCGY